MGWKIETNPPPETEQTIERRRIAKEKTEELPDWEERMLLGPQIESIMLQLNEKQFEVAKNWSGKRWAMFVYKVAGLS